MRKHSTDRGTAYEVITGRLVELIETSGELPWQRPWNTTGADAPESVRGHVYRGVNRLMLGLGAQVLGYRDNRWITFKQAKDRGGSVRRGESSLPVVLWKPVERKRTNDRGEEETDAFLVARYYRVFSVEQCDGLDIAPLPAPERHEWNPIDRAEEVAAGMPQPPALRHEGQRAFYRPSIDTVTMPPRKSFYSAEGYYGTLFHELAHATGHESRLARGLDTPQPFGSADYSREELVAELGAAFVCGAVGIDTPTADRDHAAYLANWLRVLREDVKAIVVAGARASKAADWILGLPVQS